MNDKQSLRILVVDDERTIRSFLKASLSSHGYIVFESESGEDALAKSVSVRPDAVILDLGLPDMDGVDVVKKIRKRSKVPIIILSVREDVSDKVVSLNAGADDYLTKPFSTKELIARLHAVIRRLLPAETEKILRIGKLTIDIMRRYITANGSEVKLSPTEYDILKLFITNAGKVLTHKQILLEIWNKSEDVEGIQHLLRVTISNLRGKIEPNPDRPAYIVTEPCVGYRLRMED
jgi:two-component system, OmpR family, KDP operon response regulator KdpE